MILVGCHHLEGVTRGGKRRRLKGRHSPEAMTKKVVSFLKEKIG